MHEASEIPTLTQKEAATLLAVSPRYLRASSCPKILLPGLGKAGKPMVRYDRTAVLAWRDSHRSDRLNARDGQRSNRRTA
jgi:hypothetical protein